jgi:hypothetical protein
VSRRARIGAFGSAAVAVLAGVGAALVGGLVADLIAIALITLGLGAVLLLLFLEIGLSEDRERQP